MLMKGLNRREPECPPWDSCEGCWLQSSPGGSVTTHVPREQEEDEDEEVVMKEEVETWVSRDPRADRIRT